jgi:two-component system, response regulator PdtaR
MPFEDGDMERSNPIVLIVEDEPIVRFYESELAEGAGFLTLMASNADEALRELEGPVDVKILLTDVAMPGTMDGIDLANRVRERWPEIRIVIASGHVDSQDGDGQGQIVYVRKPFTPNQLIQALQSVV